MKTVSQTIPAEQVKILVNALCVLESALNTFVTDKDNQEVEYKIFDIQTLKAMLNRTELVVNIPFEVYERFTAINGVDFPEYTK